MGECRWPGCRRDATVDVSTDESYCRHDALEVADREARIWAMERYRRICQRCGSGAMDVHHIIGKGAHPRLRHERANLLPLCRACHSWAHGHRAAFTAWIDERWPTTLGHLAALELAVERRGKIDLANVIRGFREEGLTPAEFETYRNGAWLG